MISPGPKRPEEAGCSVDVIRELGARIPTLGVCLGHQAIGIAFGGRVERCQGMHGEASAIDHDAVGLFESCPQPMNVGRYHSLAICDTSLPDQLEVTARTVAVEGESSIIMGIQHRTAPIYGVQFHPESVLSDEGHRLLANFVNLASAWNRDLACRKAAS